MGGLGLGECCQAKQADDLHFRTEENRVCGALHQEPRDSGEAGQSRQLEWPFASEPEKPCLQLLQAKPRVASRPGMPVSTKTSRGTE